MSYEERGGEEKVGTWLEVASDHMAGSWRVTERLCYAWAGVITGHSKLVLGCIGREGEGKTAGGWPIRSHRTFQGGSS